MIRTRDPDNTKYSVETVHNIHTKRPERVGVRWPEGKKTATAHDIGGDIIELRQTIAAVFFF